MKPEEITEKLDQLSKRLKLSVLSDYKNRLNPGMSFEEGLILLLEIEAAEKDRKSMERRIKNAGFPLIKTLDTFAFDAERLPHLKKEQVMELSGCEYIRQKRNVIAIGNSGTGKSHLMTALGIEAIKRGYHVKFKKASDLVNQMSEAQIDKQLTRYLKNLNNCHLLIIDELGYLTFDIQGASLLFQVFAARYETKSTIVTTNLEFSKWVSFLGDPGLSTALIDRLIHLSTLLNMNGESYRLKNAGR
jgi:DNA replication protein DnaC